MVATLEILSQKSLVVVLAYAPTGLGHLRVTDALFHGLPKSSAPLLLGSQDKSIGILHRIASIHPLARGVMEKIQAGSLETFFTFCYRRFLSTRTDILYSQLTTILDQRVTMPKTILVVSTHFGLAYELSLIKNKLERQKDIRVVLVVVVTDDSPQKLWYIPFADLTFVPSARTKAKLIEYGQSSKMPALQFEVIPYPLSPVLTQNSSNFQYSDKKNQLDFDSRKEIHICIPISGAAVGISEIMILVNTLHHFSSRFQFHILVKNVTFTKAFIGDMIVTPNIILYTSVHDRELVELYE